MPETITITLEELFSRYLHMLRESFEQLMKFHLDENCLNPDFPPYGEALDKFYDLQLEIFRFKNVMASAKRMNEVDNA